MNIYERIEKQVGYAPEAAADEIATDILRMCTKQDLAPLLVAAIETSQRNRVRAVEHARWLNTMTELRERTGAIVAFPSAKSSVERLSELRSLLARQIKVGDGTLTTWGQATLDQLRQRRAMLDSQRAGLSASIQRLDDAIGLLEQTGAPCLDAIATPGEVAA